MKTFKTLKGKEIDFVLRKFCEAVPEKGWVPKFVYDIVLHDSDTVIGECEARIGNSDSLFYNGHIGYMINPDCRGHGYAGKATELLLKVFKENGIEKVYITNDPKNNSSK